VTTPAPASDGRPRSAQVAFWLFIAAAVALIASGLLLAFSSTPVPGFFRGAGGLFAVAGMALAALAGRARRTDDPRFGRATVALAMALVLLLGMFALISMLALTRPGHIWLGIIIVLVVAAVLTLRSRGASDA
jgi:peptidoglycan/LPS O-acetylase OafA/YrhL